MSKTFDPKQHWESIYAKKDATDVSWYQAMPKVSLDLFDEYRVPMDARIIDVGGGDSLFVDHLLERVARLYDTETDMLLKKLPTLLEPVILAVLFVLVLGLALAVYLPMWKMASFARPQ